MSEVMTLLIFININVHVLQACFNRRVRISSRISQSSCIPLNGRRVWWQSAHLAGGVGCSPILSSNLVVHLILAHRQHSFIS